MKSASVAVEIRLAGLEIFLPALCLPDLALVVLDKHKRAGAEDMGLRELRVLGELGGAVDAVPGRGEIRQHRRVRPLQVKDDGQRVGRVDAADRAEIDLARRGDALRRMDDALIARLDIGRGQLRAVMKQHIGAQLERVGLPVRRDVPGLRQIADDLRVIGGIEFENVE